MTLFKTKNAVLNFEFLIICTLYKHKLLFDSHDLYLITLLLPPPPPSPHDHSIPPQKGGGVGGGWGGGEGTSAVSHQLNSEAVTYVNIPGDTALPDVEVSGGKIWKCRLKLY
jgi:hypothetical protein